MTFILTIATFTSLNLFNIIIFLLVLVPHHFYFCLATIFEYLLDIFYVSFIVIFVAPWFALGYDGLNWIWNIRNVYVTAHTLKHSNLFSYLYTSCIFQLNLCHHEYKANTLSQLEDLLNHKRIYKIYQHTISIL